MRIGQPCMEGEDRHLNGKPDKETDKYPNLEVFIGEGVSLCSG